MARPRAGRELHRRVSYGIACCRFNGTRPEILLICKRNTYAYIQFVQGKYDATRDESIIHLMNGMTVDEKHDLNSLRFEQIWYRIWLDKRSVMSSYHPARFKFETTFKSDGGLRMKNLLARSLTGHRLWEIPKGKRDDRSEPEICTAVREFQEETGVKKHQYRVHIDARRTYEYDAEGATYVNVYFPAFLTTDDIPRPQFGRRHQVDEICDIRWMNIDEIKVNDFAGRLVPLIRPIFAYMKKYARR